MDYTQHIERHAGVSGMDRQATCLLLSMGVHCTLHSLFASYSHSHVTWPFRYGLISRGSAELARNSQTYCVLLMHAEQLQSENKVNAHNKQTIMTCHEFDCKLLARREDGFSNVTN